MPLPTVSIQPNRSQLLRRESVIEREGGERKREREGRERERGRGEKERERVIQNCE